MLPIISAATILGTAFVIGAAAIFTIAVGYIACKAISKFFKHVHKYFNGDDTDEERHKAYDASFKATLVAEGLYTPSYDNTTPLYASNTETSKHKTVRKQYNFIRYEPFINGVNSNPDEECKLWRDDSILTLFASMI